MTLDLNFAAGTGPLTGPLMVERVGSLHCVNDHRNRSAMQIVYYHHHTISRQADWVPVTSTTDAHLLAYFQ